MVLGWYLGALSLNIKRNRGEGVKQSVYSSSLDQTVIRLIIITSRLVRWVLLGEKEVDAAWVVISTHYKIFIVQTCCSWNPW